MKSRAGPSVFRRRTKAAALALLAAGLPLVVDRLLILPWFASIVTATTFGNTVWLLGLAQIGASLCGTPYSFALAQNSKHSASDLSARATRDASVLGAVAIIIWIAIAGRNDLSSFWPLLVLFVVRTAAFPLETALRISNRLGTILLNRLVEFLALGSIVILLTPNSPHRLLWTLALSSACYLTLTLVTAASSAKGSRDFRAAERRRLVSNRWTAAGNVLLPQSPRLLLGMVSSPIAVSIFFATWSLIGLLNRPLSVISSLILAKLSREEDSAAMLERRRTLTMLSSLVWIGSLITAFAIGKLLVSEVYSADLQFGDPGLIALSLGAAGQSSCLMLRPFLLRFGDSQRIAKATWTAITIQLLALAGFGFVWGATGAAVAVAIGANTMLFLYFRESYRQQ